MLEEEIRPTLVPAVVNGEKELRSATEEKAECSPAVTQPKAIGDDRPRPSPFTRIWRTWRQKETVQSSEDESPSPGSQTYDEHFYDEAAAASDTVKILTEEAMVHENKSPVLSAAEEVGLPAKTAGFHTSPKAPEQSKEDYCHSSDGPQEKKIPAVTDHRDGETTALQGNQALVEEMKVAGVIMHGHELPVVSTAEDDYYLSDELSGKETPAPTVHQSGTIEMPPNQASEAEEPKVADFHWTSHEKTFVKAGKGVGTDSQIEEDRGDRTFIEARKKFKEESSFKVSGENAEPNSFHQESFGHQSGTAFERSQEEAADAIVGLEKIETADYFETEEFNTDGADAFSQSSEKDESGIDNGLIEKARRVSSVFDRRVSAAFPFSDALNADPSRSQEDCDYLKCIQSPLKDSNNPLDTCFDPLLEVKSDDDTHTSFDARTLVGPTRYIGVVVPFQRGGVNSSLEREMENLKRKLQEQEDKRLAAEEKISEIIKEREHLTKKQIEYEERVKSMELLVEKKEKDTARLLAKLTSKRALLLNLIKEKNQLEEARCGGLTKLEEETSEVNKNLADAEAAFASIHGRYEQAKAVINHVRANNEKSEAVAKELRSLVDKKEIEIVEVQHSIEVNKQQYQQKMQELKITHSEEKERLTAKLRQSLLKTKVLGSEIEQKSRENEELTAIINDLPESK